MMRKKFFRQQVVLIILFLCIENNFYIDGHCGAVFSLEGWKMRAKPPNILGVFTKETFLPSRTHNMTNVTFSLSKNYP